MIRPAQEWEIKLNLLASIVRSQEALARILESVADVASASGMPPAVVHEHIRALDSMQAALLRTVTGTGWRPPIRGTPGSPWLQEGICAGHIRAVGGVGIEAETSPLSPR